MKTMSDVPRFIVAPTEDLIVNCKGTEFMPEDFMPHKSTDRSTGYDVRCAVRGGFELRPGYYYRINLGFRCFTPPGWWLDLRPRSSSFTKRYLHALYGVLDEDWEGQSQFACQYIPNSREITNGHHYPRIEFGEKIGQIIPERRHDAEFKMVGNELLNNYFDDRAFDRKDGGFGSTGTK